tara:strand:- start:220 stop:618 length:399 start_codon:yes stop_codon:yes gene_type:complete
MIYTRINKYLMIDAFRSYGRLKTSETHGNFTEEAVEALFDYYDESTYGLKDSEITHYELDVIGICCEWTQYDDIDEVISTLFQSDNFNNYEVRNCVFSIKGKVFTHDDVFEYLEDNTYHIVLDDDSILVRDF